jgi:hypothetical protein
MYHRTAAVALSPNIRTPCGRHIGRRCSRQQPDGDDTPGVAVAPVALAGAIVPGVDRFIVMLSAHADVFGVGITAIAGSMVVSPSWVTSGAIVPGAGLAGIAGVESGNAAPLVGGPPGAELQTVLDALPSGDVGDMVPVVLPKMAVGIVPKGAADGINEFDGAMVAVLPAMAVVTVGGIVEGAGTSGAAITGGGGAGTVGGGGAGTVEPGMVERNEVAGCADSGSKGAVVLSVVDAAGVTVAVGAADGVVPVVPPMADIDAIGTAGVPGAISPEGVEQVTTVPGVVGSEANGSGASVVSGTPGWVAAENGLGPLSGDVTIAPGVEARPMAVLPMVETCAMPALQPASSSAVVSSKRRIAFPF